MGVDHFQAQNWQWLATQNCTKGSQQLVGGANASSIVFAPRQLRTTVLFQVHRPRSTEPSLRRRARQPLTHPLCPHALAQQPLDRRRSLRPSAEQPLTDPPFLRPAAQQSLTHPLFLRPAAQQPLTHPRCCAPGRSSAERRSKNPPPDATPREAH